MITATYATGSVTGTGRNVGGLVGYTSGTITASYAAGAVSGAGSNVGGLVGRNIRTTTASYWDTKASGQTDQRRRGRPDHQPAPVAHRLHRHLRQLEREY